MNFTQLLNHTLNQLNSDEDMSVLREELSSFRSLDNTNTSNRSEFMTVILDIDNQFEKVVLDHQHYNLIFGQEYDDAQIRSVVNNFEGLSIFKDVIADIRLQTLYLREYDSINYHIQTSKDKEHVEHLHKSAAFVLMNRAVSRAIIITHFTRKT